MLKTGLILSLQISDVTHGLLCSFMVRKTGDKTLARDSLKTAATILPVLGLMAGAGYYLWRDTQGTGVVSDQQIRREQVGEVKEAVSNVKRKTGDSLYWNPLKSKEALFSQDAIRTGAEGTAILVLSDKSEIDLSENSLIVLEKSAQQLAVDFRTGDIETKGGTFAIKVRDNLVQTQNADLKLRTDSKNNTQILVTKGQATLKDKQNRTTNLDTKNAISVDETGKTQAMAIPLLLNTPKDKAVILDPEKTASHPFTWTVLDENLKEQTLEVSTYVDFRRIDFRKTAHQAAKGTIQKGTNYWRVAWKKADGKLAYSEVRNLKLEEDKRITLTSPVNQAVLDQAPDQSIVTLSWTVQGDPKIFLVEIAKDPAFSTLVTSKTTASRSIDIPNVKEGQHYWRVRAFDDKNAEMGRTGGWSFLVRRLIPQLPALISPANGVKWTLNDPLPFQWKPDQNANSYRLVVSKDPQQTHLAYQHTTTEPQHLWKWTQPGEYYWSVSATNTKAEIIGQSVLQRVSVDPTVKGPAIVLKSPPDQETVTRDRRDPMDPVVFEWEVQRPISAGPFTFHISEKPDFSASLKKRNLESTKFALRLSRAANYYWKVEWVNPEDPNDIEVSHPQALKFRVNSNLPAPALIEPLPLARRVVGKKEPLTLRWKNVEGAALYRVTLERVQGAERIPVLSQTTPDTRYVSPPLEPGSYEWTVSTLDKEKVEGPGAPARTIAIELNKELLAPKLKAPLVK